MEEGEVKIGIATLCSMDYFDLGKLTMQNTVNYAQRHRYRTFTTAGSDPKGPSWDRIEFFRKCLVECDWLLAIGADVLITDHSQRVEDWIDDEKDMVISRDCNDLNDDVMLIKNTPWAQEFLQAVYDCYWEFKNNVWNEQAAMIHLLAQYPWHMQHVKVIPQKSFNSYMYSAYTGPEYGGRDYSKEPGFWERGDWILHLPGMPNERRISIVKTVLQNLSLGGKAA